MMLAAAATETDHEEVMEKVCTGLEFGVKYHCGALVVATTTKLQLFSQSVSHSVVRYRLSNESIDRFN